MSSQGPTTSPGARSAPEPSTHNLNCGSAALRSSAQLGRQRTSSGRVPASAPAVRGAAAARGGI
eukprot:4307953-Alexandrium_andersonii.AAC.1